MDLYQTKKTVSVFSPSKTCPLSYADLLVFCYRADQYRYESVPSCRKAAKATGLREPTVAEATKRLAGHGLVGADGAIVHPCPRLDWFDPLDALKERFAEGTQFSWLRNWKTLVRRPGADNPLSVPAVLIYSYLRHSAERKWKPSEGWTQEYLAKVTLTNPKTVGSALAVLAEHGFLEVGDGMRFKFFKLREGQLGCFADKGVYSCNSAEPDDVVEEFGPGSEVLEAQRAARDALVELVKGYPVEPEGREWIINAVMKNEGWEAQYAKMAMFYFSKVLDRYSAR